MGTQNKRFRAVGDLSGREAARQAIQAVLDGEKSVEERRKYGQFATPLPLAREMISYGLDLLGSGEIHFLEPAIGTGAFLSALMLETEGTARPIADATGIEVDERVVGKASDIWAETNVQIIHGSFPHVTPDKQYNLVVTNPPYVRHHCISQGEKLRLGRLVKEETGLEASGLSGLYCYFMLLAHKWLAPGAVSGWLIPSEFMDVNYGDALKTYLLEKVRLVRIHRYAPDASKFDDALVSSCVVWFRKETVAGDYEVEFSYGGMHSAPTRRKMVSKSELRKERKWTRFPAKEIRGPQPEGETIGSYFTIPRGRAAG
ncbi:MAG: Eco57I restriction-modification methylase domain-containing protein, partial [Oscillospiraceae bacterium]|nr:Eco57I restriction-modification methylase domain-containing protein [Oscillospiraceae bacterium]